MKTLLSFCALFFMLIPAFAQEQAQKPKIKGWHLLDYQTDGYRGISLNKAYEALKGRKSTPVIVAVIDSGIDTLHEDLKAVLWRNEKEINGNGIDDDGNGYIDDIYGWNFCGSKEGENLSRNSWEITRVYHNWKAEFESKKEKDISADKKFLYQQWMKSAALINKDYEEASAELPQITGFLEALEQSSKAINEHLRSNAFHINQASSLVKHADNKIARAASIWTELLTRAGGDTSIKSAVVLKEVSDYKNQLENKINRKMLLPEDTRGALTKDKYTDINDRYYGNNNLQAHSGNHGTLVSGTIAAIRNNGIGADGIADNVRIMAIRAVPGGDEHDKDVALAIRYAVDNGAKIINMSFGKPVSPYKHFVDEAIRYAAAQGVLLIHGSGNDGKDITTDHFYPHPQYLDGKKATNYLTVGASGDESLGYIAAPFSNYSKKWVDIFAPGMYIYSTTANNGYDGADGTSLASPVVTGVAALLKSYFPNLTPEQLVQLLMTSGKPVSNQVSMSDSKNKISFSSLSVSGRIINAYEAVQMALKIEQPSRKQ
jgi:subtilisin family serine protease